MLTKPTKKQIRKYIHNIKACNRIEVFFDDIVHTRWLHFISRKGKFVGFTCAIILPSDLDDFQGFVKNYIEKESCLSEALDNIGNYSTRLVRRAHVKERRRDGVIVRKHGKWTWIK